MNCLFVYNPVSGKGKTAKREGEIVRVLGEKFGQVDVYATQGPGEMTRVVRERAGGYSAIVFAGGDGTFNEVLQGVCESGADPILGYIPGGTVNDIAHSLHIPRNWKKALSVICGGHGERLDCMCANGKYAMYVVTAGAFTSATYSAPQTQKKRFGRLAYGFEGLRKNMHFDVFPVRVRGVDCPEIKGKTPQEKALAQQAKAFTKEFLSQKPVTLTDCGRDKYFRLLCGVTNAGGQDLAEELIRRGLGYAYDGGTKKDW